MAKIDLPYVQRPSGKKHFRYRRKVPAFLQAVMGRTEIIKPLGRTPAEVMRHYDRAHKEAEAELKAAAKGQPATVQPKTAYERYRWATRHTAEWNLDPEHVEIVADHLEEAGEADLYRALVAPDRKPEPTLTDAVRQYLKDKVDGTHNEETKRGRVERVQGHIEAVLGRDPEIRSLTRTDAREVRDHILGTGIKASTVERYLNDIRAILHHAIAEFELRDAHNPFHKLTVPKGQTPTLAKQDRNPFTKEQLRATRQRILGHANEDLQRIWRMLEGTGCRLGEVTGLMVDDVKLDHETPYIDLVFHPHRRLKNNGSVRRVPLVGDALAAAREAVEAAKGDLLFPTYGKPRGADNASQILMKHVRKVVADRKVTVHSLRHTMKDRLIRADVPGGVQDMILGHSSGAVSEGNGGPESRLEVAGRALSKALGR